MTRSDPAARSRRAWTQRWMARDRARRAPEHDRLAQAPAVVDLAANESSSLRLDVTPEEVEGYDGAFRITLLNPLAWPVLVTLAAYDRENKLRFRIGPENPVVVPSRRSIGPIMLRARPKRRVPWGPQHLYKIELRAYEPGREELVTPELVRYVRFKYVPLLVRALSQRATWPPWVSRAIVLLLLLLALLSLSLFVARSEEHARKAVAARPAALATLRMPAVMKRHRTVAMTTQSSRKYAHAPRQSTSVVALPTPGPGQAPGLQSDRLVAGLPLPPTLLVNPNTLRFGAQAVHTSSAARTVHVVNLSPRPLTITHLAIGEAHQANFTTFNTCTGRTIAAYSGCEVYVRFTPTTPGPHDASLSIADSAAGRPYTVQIKAVATN